MDKKFWLNKRFWIIVLFIMTIWMFLLYVLVDYAKELRSHPCSLCAEKIGDSIICSTGGRNPFTKTFYPNGTIITQKPMDSLNISLR